MKKRLKKLFVLMLVFAFAFSLVPASIIQAQAMDNNAANTQDMRARLDSRMDPRLRATSTASSTTKRILPPKQDLPDRARQAMEDKDDRKKGNDDKMKRFGTSTATSSRFGAGKGQGNGAICSRIISSEQQIISNLIKPLKDKDGHRKDLISDKRLERDQKIIEKREDNDENKALRFEKLEERADTDAEKAAVAKFKTTVEAAVTARRTAVDVAIATYRKDVDAIIAKYPLANSTTSTSTTQAARLEAAAREAIAKAKAECQANASSTNPQVILKNFQASLEKLKKDYRAIASSTTNARNAANATLKAELKTAAEKRETAIKNARSAFKTTFDAAKIELKAAFGE